MGITGLLPFVKNSCRCANVRDFSGATVAVDAYSWLHKGAFSCAEKLVRGEKTDGYVFYCMKLLNMLLDAGVKPIMVFDGCHLTSKAVTEKKRRENREKTRKRGKELLCEGKIKEAREYFQRCVDVTPEMAREVIEACREKSIDCIVAPYEADAQLAFLNVTGIAQVVITEDSDLIVFGSKKILFKMDACGGGVLYEQENLPKAFRSNASKFSFEKFRYMCILSGCDYLPSLPGIGLAKACKFFMLTNNNDVLNVLSKLPSYLKMAKLVVSNEYKESFMKANNTFLYQLVFCPKQKSLVPLNPYPEGIDTSQMEYAGKYLPDDLAYEIAIGNVHVKTLKRFEDAKPTIDGHDWNLEANSLPIDKPELSAFKFNSTKIAVAKKRNFEEMVADEDPMHIDDSELFSMYASVNNDGNEEVIEDYVSDGDEKDSKTMMNKPIEVKRIPSISSKNKNPFNLPEDYSSASSHRLVRSRFFVPDSHNEADLESHTSSQNSESSLLDNIDTELLAEKVPENNLDGLLTVLEEMETPLDQECKENSPLKVKPISLKKDNKENIIHRFAKKKKISTESPLNTERSKATTLKSPEQPSWLDILSEEASEMTSTISSKGKSTKILNERQNPSGNELEKCTPKQCDVTIKPKKITLCSKKFNFISINPPKKLYASPESEKKCFEDIFVESEKTSDTSLEITEKVSPYFTPLNCSPVDTEPMGSIEDVDDSGVIIDFVHISPPNKRANSQNPGTPKNPFNSKPKVASHSASKTTKCRTIGLSKKRKSSSKSVPRKETLLNFNFVLQPKKEVQAGS